MTASRPYTETDVRANPNLLALAVTYARGYMGTWEVLAGARDLSVRSGTLPIAVARTVLNCMRNDANVCESLPEPTTTPTVHDWGVAKKERRTSVDNQELFNSTPAAPPKLAPRQLTPKGMYCWSRNHRYAPALDPESGDRFTVPLPSMAHIVHAGSLIRWDAKPSAFLRMLCGHKFTRHFDVGGEEPVFQGQHPLCRLCYMQVVREIENHYDIQPGWVREETSPW